MKITPMQVRVAELINNYKDDGDDGVFGYDRRLTIRPAYQREFVYKDKQRDAVIDTVMKGFPLNVMYWSKTGDDTYEVLDGQQRTISIAQYINGGFSIENRFFFNLTDTEKQRILDYELTVYICEGTEEEKLQWFRIINIAGETLTEQELLNATYTGPWLSDAKNYFSKRNCPAAALADGYMKGNPMRQELLGKVLEWIADRDGLKNKQEYMALHQHDADANDLWLYFNSVMNWAKTLFSKRKKITDVQNWGILYNQYHEEKYVSSELEEDMKRLLTDEDVTSNAGIIPYLLDGKSKTSERYLSIRGFDSRQKRRAYEIQNGICKICGETFDIDEMEADHIIPWSEGGHTSDDNCQMLCKDCNRRKSNK